jgi:hypothetical protein
MTKLLLVLLCLFMFVPAHVNYYQVVYTAPLSKDIYKNDEQYVYKGDSLDVAYSFWADGGVMAFMVLNKSKTPVYIDWTKSAYKDHNTTAQYYPINRSGNSILSKASEVYKTPQDWYRLFAPYILSGYEGVGGGLTEEPVTLLPPRSYVFRACYRILPNTILSVKKLSPTEIPFISGMRDKFPGWQMESDSTNASLVFGNSIVYDTQKDFTNARQINNRFYVWRVLTFEEEYFEGYDKDNNSVNSPYHSDKRYFISNLRLSDID